jgi:hypothetical protein
MYTNDDLEAAVAAGALSPEAAGALRDYVADRRATPVVDEEHFRLLTGFNDIFVGTAAVILLVAVAWIGNSVRPGLEAGTLSPFSGLFIAASAWGLAEFFTRKRRMALPSIILLLAFVGGVFAAAGGIASLIFPQSVHSNNETLVLFIVAACAAIAATGAWLHWRRFKVPITIAAGAGAVAGLLLALLATIFRDAEHSREIMLAFLLLTGTGMFLVAMWWDASDPRRETRQSDVAFWLHLLAAPMIVHPIFALLGLTDGEATIPEGIVVLVVYIGLGITALAIDRRAFLVSALAYVLWALTNLFERFQVVELSFALTALLIGSALLLLSAFWHDARRAVVTSLPASLRSKLPVLDRRAQPNPA